jgi:hypothetical protein
MVPGAQARRVTCGGGAPILDFDCYRQVGPWALGGEVMQGDAGPRGHVFRDLGLRDEGKLSHEFREGAGLLW